MPQPRLDRPGCCKTYVCCIVNGGTLANSAPCAFAPCLCLQVGDRITAGDIYGTVMDNSLLDLKVRSTGHMGSAFDGRRKAKDCKLCPSFG